MKKWPMFLLAALVCPLHAFEYPYQEYVHRHAECGDVLFLLEVTNAIERSKASRFISVYPYALRASRLHDLIKKQQLFIAADPDNQAVSIMTLSLLQPQEVAEIMDATAMKDWRSVHDLNDVFLTSADWYTEPVLRQRGTCQKLLAYGLQTLAERVAYALKQHKSSRVYLLVRIVDEAVKDGLVKHLITMMQDQFADFVETMNSDYMRESKPVKYGMTIINTTQSFYDLEANELKIIQTRPAYQYVLFAQLPPLD